MVQLDSNLQQCYDDYFKYAIKIPGWEFLSKTQVANGYCDAEEANNLPLRDNYFSLLVCKFFYLVPYLYDNNKEFLRIQPEDTLNWVVDGLLKGLRYRTWRDENSGISCEKVLNKCIDSIRLNEYVKANGQKLKLNYTCGYLDELGIDYPGIEKEDGEDMCNDVIHYYLGRSKILNAVIIDLICFDDTFNDDGFSKRKIMRRINEICKDDNYYKYFAERYFIKESKVSKAFRNVYSGVLAGKQIEYCKRLTNNKFRAIVDETLNDLKTNKTIRGILC